MNEEKMKNVPEGFICQQFTDILIISERGTIGKGDGVDQRAEEGSGFVEMMGNPSFLAVRRDLRMIG